MDYPGTLCSILEQFKPKIKQQQQKYNNILSTIINVFFYFRDIAPEGDTLAESNKNLDEITDLALELQKKTGVKLLWSTCNLFAHQRYVCTLWHHPHD